MPEQCIDHERDAQRAGDRYYAAMTAWLTRRKRSEEEGRRAFDLARIYNRSLDLLIACLERIQHRSDVRRKLRQAAELRSHLEEEIEILSSTAGGLTSQTDET
jgi:hypothetical protein